MQPRVLIVVQLLLLLAQIQIIGADAIAAPVGNGTAKEAAGQKQRLEELADNQKQLLEEKSAKKDGQGNEAERMKQSNREQSSTGEGYWSWGRTELQEGLAKLSSAGHKLQEGLDKLSSAGHKLLEGLAKLSSDNFALFITVVLALFTLFITVVLALFAYHVSALRSEIYALRGEFGTLKEKMPTTRSVVTLDEKFADDRIQFLAKIDFLKAELVRIGKAEAARATKFATVEAELKKSTKELAKLAAERVHLCSDVAVLKDRTVGVQEAIVKIAELTKSTKGMAARIGKLAEDKFGLFTRLNGDLSAVKTDVAVLNERTEGVKEAIVKLEERINKLQSREQQHVGRHCSSTSSLMSPS